MVPCPGRETTSARRPAGTGPNVLHPRPERAIALQFLSRLGNPLVVLLPAMALPCTPVGATPGFVPLPAPFFALLAGMTVVHPGSVEEVKGWFYRPRGRSPKRIPATVE